MKIIPTPKKNQQRDGYFRILQNTVITADRFENPFAVLFLQKHIEKKCATLCRISAIEGESTIGFYTKSFDGNEQAYTIEITEKRIEIAAESDCGLYYGAVTLCQMIDEFGVQLPCCLISDWCDIEKRGVLYDITRGKVAKLETIKRVIKTLSYYKINQLYLYTEHAFEYSKISEAWRGTSALSAAEILKIRVYAEKYHVELVPCFASFGHLYQILSTKSYGHLAEVTTVKNKFSWIDRQIHHVVDVSNPQSEALIQSMLDETAPLFQSEYFNLCCDETFDLGTEKSKALRDKMGKAQLYGEYVSKLCNYIKAKGKKPMVFCDILLENTDICAERFSDVTMIVWDYEEGGCEEAIKKISQTGCEQFVCSGVSGWCRYINDYGLALKNIRIICTQAAKYQVKGYINTDWGDMGHINFHHTAEALYAYGAQYSWNAQGPDCETIISQKVYNDGEIVELLKQLSASQIFNWGDIGSWYEEKMGYTFKETDMVKPWVTEEFINAKSIEEIRSAYETARRLKETFRDKMAAATEEFKPKFEFLVSAAEAIAISTAFLSIIRITQFGKDGEFLEEPGKLAEKFEYWLWDYENLWRKYYEESELRRIQQTVYFVCDTLRDIR